MNFRLPAIAFATLMLSSCDQRTEQQDLVQFVNPFIGTGGHGHTYPGASVPFGMVQLSPDSRTDNWDACSGYHYSDSTILGFSHTHLSGTGCIDYGDIRMMPFTGENMWLPGDENNPEEGYRSRFSHQSEGAAAGYYSVLLTDYNIEVELSATERCGMHQYTFPEGEERKVIIDLLHGVSNDELLEINIVKGSDNSVSGMRNTKGWANNQQLYFVAEFSESFRDLAMSKSNIGKNGQNKMVNGQAIASFEAGDKPLVIKVGISAVSVEGARKNLQEEIPGFDFSKIRVAAGQRWNEELNKVQVQGGSQEQKTIFYTALYHSFLNPNIYQDVDGQYRGMDGKVHQAEGFKNYTVFSLWDTYRATHPLFTILQQERTNDMINSLLSKHREGGILPIWELAGCYTGTMIGYHAIPVIADAWMKDIRGFDGTLALEAMRNAADQDHLGLKQYKTQGYIPADQEHESVSKTLEYAYDDWCIAQMAGDVGNTALHERFSSRAGFYQNQFDVESGFMRPRRNGKWMTPFVPHEVTRDYTEANAWQYSFYVPQDVYGMIDMMGGREVFVQKLDDLFSTSSDLTGHSQPDISGLIGQYAHGNEPSHHMAYLYNYAGAAHKTQAIVHEIMQTMYSAAPDGLSGNEDCGQMSSWAVFSALGFYPVCPGSNQYVIGTPTFSSAKLQLENGKTFTIEAAQVGEANYYIQSATLNGKDFSRSYILHEELMAGGTLHFEMGPTPNLSWATSSDGIPPTMELHKQVATPFLSALDKVFLDSMIISMGCITPGSTIRYVLDGTEPTENSFAYSEPFALNSSAALRMKAFSANFKPSMVAEAEFIKQPYKRTLTLENTYAAQYDGGSKLALVDYTRGTTHFKNGWQGFHEVDLVATIDLHGSKELTKVGAGFLQDQKSWIFMPKNVEILISTDGKKFNRIADYTVVSELKSDSVFIQNIEKTFAKQLVRKIKIVAKNIGKCPAWHPGAGGQAWLFVDEIYFE